MKKILIRVTVAVSIGFVCTAYSNKGGNANGLKISRAVANDGTFVTLQWNSSPEKRYAVETSIDMRKWDEIAKDIIDPVAPRQFVYQIPDEYVFDARRFFRVVTTDK